MLAHNSAAYHPALAQKSQAELLTAMLGRVMSGGGVAEASRPAEPVTSRQALRRPLHVSDKAKVSRARTMLQGRSEKWAREVGRRKHRSQKHCSGAAGSRRVKRAVFSKRKQKKARRCKKVCLRGLNVQWPFSQLLLAGIKTEEVRGYALGHMNMAKADEDLWLVETPGPVANAGLNACLPERRDLPSRPA